MWEKICLQKDVKNVKRGDKMKTINDLNMEEKLNLILYKTFRQEYVGSTIGAAMLSLLIIVFGVVIALLSIFLVDFLPSTWKIALLLSWLFFISTIVWITGVILFGISIFMLDKKKRKLQFAFQAETIGYFDNIFTIDDNDIKNVKRAWKLGEKK